jgi:hypothetical protein
MTDRDPDVAALLDEVALAQMKADDLYVQLCHQRPADMPRRSLDHVLLERRMAIRNEKRAARPGALWAFQTGERDQLGDDHTQVEHE